PTDGGHGALHNATGIGHGHLLGGYSSTRRAWRGHFTTRRAWRGHFTTRRAWRGHFTFHFPAAISRIPNAIQQDDSAAAGMFVADPEASSHHRRSSTFRRG